MGSGKSTVGKVLAERLVLPYIDLDEEIERREGITIEEIFESKGEDYFRDVESDVLKSLGCKEAVVATGGGIVERSENVSFMRGTGVVFFLMMPFSLFLKRMELLRDGRPLLKRSFEEIKDLFKRREGLYRKAAHVVVDIEGKSPEEIAAYIEEIWLLR